MVMVVGERRDDAGAQLVRLGMGKFERRHLLEVTVQDPGVVDQALQDQGLPPRHGAALAAHDRARCKLRARRLVGAAKGRRRTLWTAAASGVSGIEPAPAGAA